MSQNATEITYGLLANLPKFQDGYRPAVGPSMIRELKASGYLWLVCAFIDMATIVLLVVRAKQSSEPLWIFRKIRREKGAYVIVNSILVWLPAAVAFSVLIAVTMLIRAAVAEQKMSYKNFLLLILITNIPTGTVAILLTSAFFFSAISTLRSTKGKTRFDLPAPWLFHIFQFGIPFICLASILSVAVIGNRKFNDLNDIFGQLVQIVPSLATRIPAADEFSPELLLSLDLAGKAEALVIDVILYSNVGVGIFCLWCIVSRYNTQTARSVKNFQGYLLAFIPLGALLSYELYNAITMAKSQTNAGDASQGTKGFGKGKRSNMFSRPVNRQNALIQKHRLLIGFIVFSALWAISDLTFGSYIFFNSAKIFAMSTEAMLRIQWLSMSWASFAFSMALAITLFVRTWQGETGESSSDSTSQQMQPAFSIQTHTVTQVEEDYADTDSKMPLPIKMNVLKSDSTGKDSTYDDEKVVSHLVKFGDHRHNRDV